MIDIHSHIIPFVDDGSSSFEQSLKMIDEAMKQGITDIICTPHYRKNVFSVNIEEIKKQFMMLKEQTQEKAIRLFLGQEIYCHKNEEVMELLHNGVVVTLNNSNFILLEFSYLDKIDISEIAYVAVLKGYMPIIAHIERYHYLDLETVKEIKNSGGFIQVNASSLVGKEGAKLKKFVFALLKEKLVDFVASDIHEKRQNWMNKAYNIVVKKFGQDYGQRIFNDNALRILS
ncbi:MAG: CpsB/CapC family capsule biosynthesis tyrosine phosphatase [Bacilli bacterium]|nr:CpsB/CapC family capsule biosynthesis tyrosine phosphatase [Bacilli bacterium]